MRENIRPPCFTGFAAKSIALLLFAVIAVMAPSASVAQETTGQSTEERTEDSGSAEVPEAPEVDAGAWALADAETGLILDAENADERLPIASITKIMVALVALEEGVDLDEEVVISEQAERFVGFTYSNVGLIQGESVSVRDLLIAALVPSGTEAVYALAEHLGEGQGEAAVEQFVERMNEKADELGLEDTSFQNPAGLDDPENYSSARDLTRITDEAMRYEVFSEIIRQTEATLSTNTREIEVFTTNQLLLQYPEATGVKTGTSPEAGPSLVASAEEGNESYIAVILDSDGDQARFDSAQELLSHAFARYEKSQVIREGEPYEERELPFRRDESVELVAARTITAPVDAASEIEREVDVEELPQSAGRGDEIGTVEVFVEGQSVGASPLLAESGYEEASFPQKTWFRVSGFFR